MKKMVLFIAALLLVGTTAQAADHKHSDHHDRVAKRYHHKQPITFVEGGVKFFVYPNGEIDFKILKRGVRSRHANWNNNRYNTPGSYGYYNRPYYNNRGIKYDYYGRLKKVGPNYISYTRYDKVRRIGGVYMRYNRRGLLSRVGGLQIYYNRYGVIKYVDGNVHYDGCGYCGVTGCSVTHDPYYNQNWKSKYKRQDHDDDDHYYKNRKRKKKYYDDDNDDDDDD
ncbi:hypothetical protein [Aquimarina mytili]|uniref:Uncharacterized protein n=1 Tax=Aquimarina mytili TaxID=874423 RepID=A0A937A7B0_9FLAO|nr:hypothetical protein [Aquimarina mytili]MBL0685564.1 hypothetical protein [Aquimarina mytili]